MGRAAVMLIYATIFSGVYAANSNPFMAALAVLTFGMFLRGLAKYIVDEIKEKPEAETETETIERITR